MVWKVRYKSEAQDHQHGLISQSTQSQITKERTQHPGTHWPAGIQFFVHPPRHRRVVFYSFPADHPRAWSAGYKIYDDPIESDQAIYPPTGFHRLPPN